MIKVWAKMKKKSGIAIPVGMTLFALSLSVMRCFYTGTGAFLFLNWNLFLAAIPPGLAFLLTHPKVRGKVAKILLFGLWLFFFPNSLYIFTDFIHLGGYTWYVPQWYDFILILSYSLCGLYYAISSIGRLEKHFQSGMSAKKLNFLLAAVFYLASFGVYLGRFLRWNSWDLITRPHLVLLDIASLLTSPIENARAWVFTGLLGTLFSLFYFAWRQFRPGPKNETASCVCPDLHLQSDNDIQKTR